MSKFDFTTINEFDNHISNSIKGYDVLHQLIITMSSFFIKENSVVIDIGCTSGKLLNKLSNTYSDINCSYIGYDITDANFIQSNSVKLIKQDVTDSNFFIQECEIIYAIFTLQFLPIDTRLAILKKFYHALKINGALFLCEKEICKDGRMQEVFTFSNYDYKKLNFSSSEILEKELNLRPVLNPLISGKNLQLLQDAGFNSIETFFQSLNFKGYLCIK